MKRLFDSAIDLLGKSSIITRIANDASRKKAVFLSDFPIELEEMIIIAIESRLR